MADAYEIMIKIIAEGGGDVDKVRDVIDRAQAAVEKYGKDSAQAFLATAAAQKVAGEETRAAINNYANLGQAGESSTAAIAKGVTLATLATKALELGIQALKNAFDHALDVDKLRLQFAGLEGSIQGATARMQQIKQQGAFLPFDQNEILRGALELQRFSQGALRSADDLKALSGISLVTGKSLAELGTVVGKAYHDIASGQNIERGIDELQKLGVITDQQAEKMRKMAEDGASNASIWKIAGDSISEYSRNVDAAKGTLTAAYADIKKAWDDLLMTAGVEPKQIFINFLKSLSEAIKSTKEQLQGLLNLWNAFATVGGATINGVVPVPGGLAGAKSRQGGKQLTWEDIPEIGEVIQPVKGVTPSDKTKKDSGGGGGANDQEERSLEKQRELLVQIIKLRQQEIDQNPFLSANDKLQATIMNLQQEAQVLQKNIDEMKQYIALHQGESTPFLDTIKKKLIEQQHLLVMNAQKLQELQNPVSAGLMKWATSFGTVGQQVAHTMTDVLGGAIGNISQGIMGLINGTMTFGQVFAQIGTSIIQALIQMVVQMLVVNAVQKLLQATGLAGQASGVATATATGAAQFAAYAPAAMAASIASYGAADIAGMAGFQTAMASALLGGVGLATGGLVGAARSGRDSRDTVAAWLDPEEFVLRREAVQAYGTDFLHRINSRQVPTSRLGFAGGGPVSISSMGGGSGAGVASAGRGRGAAGHKVVVLSDARQAASEAARDPSMRMHFINTLRKNRYVAGF